VTSIGGCAFYGCSGLTSIVCLATLPPQCYNPFTSVTTESCTLSVPEGCASAYRNAPDWRDFYNIKEDATDIVVLKDTRDFEERSRYTLDGQRISQPRRGMNIVKMSDGTVKKVVVK